MFLIFRFKYLPDGKPLRNDKLKEELTEISSEWKKLAAQLIDVGSTQANENFNNIVASKAPKSR